jgi:Rha family phage regulatory protein
MKSLIPNLSITEGKATTTSLDIASNFTKRHDVVLRAIENLDCSKEFNRHNFVETSYQDSSNRSQPMHIITRDGFAFLCMGFTGKKAAEWKEKYIKSFNKMENELQKKYLQAKLKNKKTLQSEWKAFPKLMVEAHYDDGSSIQFLQNKGLSTDGEIPEQYMEIPVSMFMSFRNLAKNGNLWASNLLKRTENIEVPLELNGVAKFHQEQKEIEN